MKFFVTFCLFVAAASAFPQKKDLDNHRQAKNDPLTGLNGGCSPEQLLDLDAENIACYKRVKLGPDYKPGPILNLTHSYKLGVLKPSKFLSIHYLCYTYVT